MSITDVNSILVIGAGTSIQYGLPDGHKMFELISKQIDLEVSQDNRNFIIRNHHNMMLGYNHKDSIMKAPIIAASLLKNYIPEEGLNDHYRRQLRDKTFEEARALSKRLSNQTSETIDDFIFQNPDLAEITKIAIATVIFNKLYEPDEYGEIYHLRRLDARYFEFETTRDTPKIPDERNWVHLLINLVREGIRTKSVSPANKVKIISFNYDMILEYILDKQFSNTSAHIFEDGEDGEVTTEWSNYIELKHVHGKFEGMLKTIEVPYNLIISWAESITVIHEEHTPECVNTERAQAVKMMAVSFTVYATGFSFSKSNVELIGMMDTTIKRPQIKIYYTNYDGDYGLKTAMDNYKYGPNLVGQRAKMYRKSISTVESPGKDNKVMSAVNWFYSGVPGRLPS